MKREPIPRLCRQIWKLYDEEQAIRRMWTREYPDRPYHPNPQTVEQIEKKQKELKRLLSETS